MNEGKQDLVQQIFARAPFIRSLEIELVSFGAGWCETRVSVTSRLEQQHGLVHAGVLMALADHTCGGAAATLIPHGQDVITVSNNFSFLRPALGPVLYCRAQVLRAGHRLSFVEADVTVERGEGRMISVKATSTLAIVPLNSVAQERDNQTATKT
ncbi:MAG TPA: PaaI family thioesterase [Terriglobales bacterium]|nr:PaaI family thioesterase [Terriglobales bacterium]